MNLVPGDIVVHGGETGVVWSALTRTVIVLPAKPKRGASRSSDVELGVVPISTIAGPMRVNIFERTEWPADCVRVGLMTPEQLAAMRLTIRRARITGALRQACGIRNTPDQPLACALAVGALAVR